MRRLTAPETPARANRPRWLALAVAFVSPLLFGSVCGRPCRDDGGPCQNRVPVGDNVYVTVFERWDENSTIVDPRRPNTLPRCEALAFQAGARIVLEIAGVTDASRPSGSNCDCLTGFAHATALTTGERSFDPTPVMWREDWELPDHPIQSWDHVVVDPSCQGTLIIAFGLTTNPKASGTEFGALTRYFVPDEGSCLNHPMAEGAPGSPPDPNWKGRPPYPHGLLPPGCQDSYIVTALDVPPPDWPAELGPASPAGAAASQ